jgi:hypothetical protein
MTMTVGGLTARYANYLIHPLRPGAGVCATCHGPVDPRFPSCRACHENARVLGRARLANAVLPVSLALKGGQYANELWRYKNLSGRESAHFQQGLAAVLWKFLAGHERCAAEYGGLTNRFPIVTTVPSTRQRSEHPLRAMVARTIGATRDRYQDLLTPAPEARTMGRVPAARRYLSRPVPEGSGVLLIDDTWTTGSHAQSAAAALRAAGAGPVAVVVLGRHVNPDWPGSADHHDRARQRRFSWGGCVLRPGEHGDSR